MSENNKRDIIHRERLVAFIKGLKFCGMKQENIITLGYDFALKTYLTEFELYTSRGEPLSNAIQLESMMKAVKLLQESVGGNL